MPEGERPLKERPVGVEGRDFIPARKSALDLHGEAKEATPIPINPNAAKHLSDWFAAIAPSAKADAGPPGGHKLTEALRRADIERAHQVLEDAQKAADEARNVLARHGAVPERRGVVAAEMRLPGEPPLRKRP